MRTRFLGAQARIEGEPALPVRMVQSLWGETLPRGAGQEHLRELLEALVDGLWQDLTRHQNPRTKFRLSPVELSLANADVVNFATTRHEEVLGFIDGLFGDSETCDLPESAHYAIERLRMIRGMLKGLLNLLEDPCSTESPEEVDALLPQLQSLTAAIEQDMHIALLSCTRARLLIAAGVQPPPPE